MEVGMKEMEIPPLMNVTNYTLLGNITYMCNASALGKKRDSFYIVIPIILIYVLMLITGIIGNISTCIVIFRNKSMHTATNYYLFSLAISDLVLLISGVPQEVAVIYSRYPYVFGSVFCFLRGMFAEMSSNATVLTITAFTVERYLAICHPFLSHTMSKLSRAVKLIFVIWLFSIGVAIPQAMQFSIVGYGECTLCDFTEPFIKHSFEVSTLVFFVLPMTLITVLYVLIGRKLKTSNMMKTRNALGNTGSRVHSKSSRKVVKMLVAVVVAFFICWAPFHAQRLFTLHSEVHYDDPNHGYYLQIYEIVTYISGILYYMSATVNPILYNIMSNKFREAFKETFSRCCHFKSSRPQRSYSVLSRSAQRGPDSTDSGRDDPTLHSHTSVTQKTSVESFNGLHHSIRRNKTFSTFRGADIEEETLQNIGWKKEILQSNSAMAIPRSNSEATTPNAKFISLHINSATPPRRLGKFWQYFECIAKRTLDDGKRLSAYYSSPVKEPSILLELETSPKKPEGCMSPCDISNSSLKDVESGAIEDELTTYMREVRRREVYS